ncbi:MAG TPA: carboxylate-amine ligase, partial [Phnomibacter sp.]|nr:carboxylate-amine ligase [Phnomibacter sp.]
IYPRPLINENKWRASRYGIDGTLIDFGKEAEVNTRALIYELLDFVDDVVDALGSRQSVNYVRRMLEAGTGADRQLLVYEKSGQDLVKVVEYCEEMFLK